MSEMQYLASLKRVMSERSKKEKQIPSVAYQAAGRPDNMVLGREQGVRVSTSSHLADRYYPYSKDAAMTRSGVEGKQRKASSRYNDSLMLVVPILNKRAHKFLGPVRSGYAECNALFEDSLRNQNMSHCDAILKCTAALVEELSYDSDHVVRSIQLMNQARFYFATGEQVEWQIGELLQRSCVFADCSNDMLCKACSSCNLAFFQSLINDHKAAYEHSNKAMSCATDPCCLTSDEFVDSQEVCWRVMTAASLVQGRALLYWGEDFIGVYERAWNYASKLSDKFEVLKSRMREEYLTALRAESARISSFRARKNPLRQIFSHPFDGFLVRMHKEEKREVSLPLHSKLVLTLAVANANILQNAQRCHIARSKLRSLKGMNPNLAFAASKLQNVFRAHLSKHKCQNALLKRRSRSALFLQKRVTEKLFEMTLSRRLVLQQRNKFGFGNGSRLQPGRLVPRSLEQMLLNLWDPSVEMRQTELASLFLMSGMSARDFQEFCDHAATPTLKDKRAKSNAVDHALELFARTLTLQDRNAIREAHAIFRHSDTNGQGSVSFLQCRQVLQTFGYSDGEIERGIDDVVSWYGIESFEMVMHPHFLDLYVSVSSNLVHVSSSPSDVPSPPLYAPSFLLPSAASAAFTLGSAWKATLARRRLCERMQKHVTRLGLGKALRDLPAMRNDKFMRESCASTISRSVRSFLARKTIMRLRLSRPHTLLVRLKWHQESAASRIQKWWMNLGEKQLFLRKRRESEDRQRL
mmetsp:Transcript_32100/g.102221  ORF Transcript_32100/g.102221 Transcript_32100/m.102221 type:complete len:752 (-) Transcript_32100:1259-3514(-)